MFRTVAIALLTLAAPAAAQAPESVRPPSPQPYARAIAAGYKALTLCEGLFDAGRSEAQVAAVELRGIYPEYDRIVPTLAASIDRPSRIVSVPFDATLVPRRASWRPATGCVLDPIGATIVRPPLQLASAAVPVPADPRPWPLGDGDAPPRADAALDTLLVAAFDRMRYGPGSVTTGVLIVRDGRIVGERYAEGFGPLVSNRTWSVAKSIAGTLAGIAASRVAIDPARPANIPEWRTPGDPRAAITLDQLLRMASGLHSDTAGNRTDALYFGGTAVTENATGWPIEAAPGTRFRYANNDILLAIRALRATLGEPAYAALPGGLLRPLGMNHTVTGTDWQGNFLLSSQVWSTPRDLARLGQFWLQDGVWQGRRLLPAGWMRYLTTPAGPQPANGPGYGATMWLFGPAQGLPAGSYAAQGNRGQSVMVIPSHRLVIVRRGEDPGSARFDIARFSADVIAAGAR